MQIRAQGATEYLVLLAVVLIVALISVALLGFFPGMASDAQITQSQMYWRSAQPVSIVESGAVAQVSGGMTYPYMRIRNSGAYSIRIMGIIGGDGVKNPMFRGYGGDCGATDPANIGDYYYMAPGEEKYFDLWFGSPCRWFFYASMSPSGNTQVGGASSVCQISTTSPGALDYKSLGFEYVEYVEGQQITKRQMGKEFIVKCLPPV